MRRWCCSHSGTWRCRQSLSLLLSCMHCCLHVPAGATCFAHPNTELLSVPAISLSLHAITASQAMRCCSIALNMSCGTLWLSTPAQRPDILELADAAASASASSAARRSCVCLCVCGQAPDSTTAHTRCQHVKRSGHVDAQMLSCQCCLCLMPAKVHAHIVLVWPRHHHDTAHLPHALILLPPEALLLISLHLDCCHGLLCLKLELE